MPRPLGLPKTGGRKRGTRNRRTGILVEELHGLGFHPIEELIKLMPDLGPEARARTLLSMLGFLYPRKTATETTFEEEAALHRIQKLEEEEAGFESGEEICET